MSRRSIGYITESVASPQAFTAKAYCHFNGTGTPAIYNSVNISSITDNGVGDYIFNYTTAIGSDDYLVLGIGSKVPGPYSAANATYCNIPGDTVFSASVELYWINANGAVADTDHNTMAVFV